MPQKKTRTAAKHKQNKNKTTSNHNIYKRFSRPPTPYPFSSISPTGETTGTITSSSSAMRAVSRDGKRWHVDTNVNGVKKHTNLTNSQIMDILAYPAAKQDLITRIQRDFRAPLMPIFSKEDLGIGEEEPKIRYIYKKGCSNIPVMLNKLSELHEAKIVPDSSGEPIRLVDMETRGSTKPLRKTLIKNKKYRKNRN